MRITNFFKKGFAKLSYLLNDPPNSFLFSLRYRYHNKLDISFSDKHLKFSTSDPISKKWFFPRYRDGSPHEPPVTKRLAGELHKNSIFFDCGANLGFYTVVGQVFCTQGEVHSFEMDPDLISIIKNNVELNRNRENSNVVINCLALTDKSGKLERFADVEEGNRSTNSLLFDKTERVQISSMTLDDYCKITGVVPDVVKIDVEGSEKLVLEGMTETLNSPRLKTIFLEVHPTLIPDSKSEEVLSYISELMKDNSFTTYKFSSRRDKNSKLKRIDTLEFIDQDKMILCRR